MSSFHALLLSALTFSSIAAFAQTTATETDYSLPGPASIPTAGLIQASDGNFYGTSKDGEVTGSIFQVTPAGVITVIYQFTNGDDGENPGAGLVEGPDGNLWGGTTSGGANGFGILFKCTFAGVLTPVYAFTNGFVANNFGGLVQSLAVGPGGSFYGTLPQAGTTEAGEIFTYSPQNGFHSEYDYLDPDFGAQPEGPVLLTTDGNPYGTTLNGYMSNNREYGTVWGIQGGVYTTLHVFAGGADGETPYGGLAAGANGLLYGTTALGGGSSNSGVIFSVNPADAANMYDYTVLHKLNGAGDGSVPEGGLFLAADGNLYGTAAGAGAGGDNSFGTVFQQQPGGSFTTLHSFAGGTTDGREPEQPPIGDNLGNLWGTTSLGGSNNGTVYKLTLSPALPVPVQLSLNLSTITVGAGVILNWKVLNATSDSMLQCYAFAPSGAGNWTGQQEGTYSSGTLSGSANLTPTKAGTYTYALTCGGIESGFATLTVNPKAATTLALSLSPQKVPYNTETNLTAQLSYSGQTNPTGTINFYSGSLLLGTSGFYQPGKVILSANASVPPGSYPVYAVYPGDSVYAAATSPTITATVVKDTTSVSLTATPESVPPGQQVTLQAKVTRTEGSGNLSGSAAFYYGTVKLGSAALDMSGVATYTASTTGVPAGKYSVHALYSGDTYAAGSTSANVTVTVQ